MRISDWSSDVCSSDLVGRTGLERREGRLELERDELDLGRIAKNPGGGPTEVRLKSFPVALVVERAEARRPAGRHPAEQLAACLDGVHRIAGRPPGLQDRKSTRLNSRHSCAARMPSIA